MTTYTEFFLYLFAKIASDFAIHFFVMLVAPYQSMRCIKENDSKSGMKWLTFWVVYAVLESFEKHIEFILDIFPLYFTFKLLFVIFLMFFNGSELLFFYILDPLVTKLIKYTNKKLDKVTKGLLSVKTDDLTAKEINSNTESRSVGKLNPEATAPFEDKKNS